MKFHYDAIYVFWHFDLFNTKFKHCTHSYFGNFFLEFWPEFVRKVLCHDSWIYLYSQRVNYKTSILYQACRKCTDQFHHMFFIQWDAASSNICAFQCTLFMCVFRVSLVFKTFSQMLQTRPGWVMCWASTCFEMSFLSLENFPQSRHVHISLPSVGFFTFVMCSAIRLSRCASP